MELALRYRVSEIIFRENDDLIQVFENLVKIIYLFLVLSCIFFYILLFILFFKLCTFCFFPDMVETLLQILVIFGGIICNSEYKSLQYLSAGNFQVDKSREELNGIIMKLVGWVFQNLKFQI